MTERKAVDGNDVFKVSIEVKRGADASAVDATLKDAVKQPFNLTPEVELLPTGILAREFESAIKAPRFVDRR